MSNSYECAVRDLKCGIVIAFIISNMVGDYGTYASRNTGIPEDMDISAVTRSSGALRNEIFRTREASNIRESCDL
jgi:hypothetical protein